MYKELTIYEAQLNKEFLLSFCPYDITVIYFLFSGILLASGVPYHQAVNAIRLSVGRETTTGDIDIAIKDLKLAVTTLSCNNLA